METFGIALLALAIGLLLGHFWGSRSEAWYWRHHGDHGGALCSAGRFYYVYRTPAADDYEEHA